VLSAEFQDALLGLGGPGGDQFYNPFGLNPSNTQEVIDGILISGTRTILTNIETAADVQVSGKFGELPGGAVGAAFGLQWRNQELGQYADAEELSGVIEGGGGVLPLIDDRRINSAFAEVVLPLLPSLEAQLALRYDDYSDFGSTTNPKVGLGWRPMDEILLRATWGTSFRPPTFRELFDPVYEYIAFVFNDPWRCPVTESFEDCEGQEVDALNVGNPELQPDEGETRLLGVAWEPHWAPGLAIAVDLWAIDHQNRVLFVGDGFSGVFDFFLEESPPDSNPYVIRAAPSPEDVALGIPGPITGIVSTYVNAGEVTTRGIDIEARYGWSTDRAGDFNLGFNYTYLDEFAIGISDSGAELKEDWAGAYGSRGALPHNRGNLTFHWERNLHTVTALYHYIGSYESPLNLTINNLETDRPFKVEAYTQFDLQYSYTFERLRGATLRLGCQNCTDEDPPVYNYNVTAEAFHEGRGALVYARWTQPF
jgi:outer membrane receptor protein involved in Fe transport